MFKVGIIGPESTGKSTLAKYLAKRYKGTCVPEYARMYIERKGTQEVTYDELCDIAKHQIEEIERTYHLSPLYLRHRTHRHKGLVRLRLWSCTGMVE